MFSKRFPIGPLGLILLGLALLGGGLVAAPAGAAVGQGRMPPRNGTAAGSLLLGSTPTETPAPSMMPACGVPAAWEPGPSLMPGSYLVGGVTAADGNFYVFDGADAGYQPTSRAARFNPLSNTWTSLTPAPVTVHSAGVGAPIPGKIYVAGGAVDCPLTCTLTSTLQIYDLTSASWSFGPPLPLPRGVEVPAAATYNGKFYLFGGDDGVATVYTSTLIYDPATGAWTQGAPLPASRVSAVATAAGDRIYVYGGCADFNCAQTSDALYIYHPATDTWSLGAPSGDPEWTAGLSVYTADQLLVSGGARTINGGSVSTDTTHLYNLTTNTWTAGPRLGEPRAAQAQGRLPDGRVIVYGGGNFPLKVLESTELLAPGVPCATPSATASPPVPPTGTATATRTPPPCTIPFSDVQPADYFYEPVRYLYCQGVVSGYGDGTFRPYANTTRAQQVKIVVLGFGLPIQTPTTPTFSDVPPAHPFYAVIETAAAHNIVSGYGDGTFHPSAAVTRSQVAKIAAVAAGWPLLNPARPTFTDVGPGSAFYAFVETAVCHGVVSGYGDQTFRPGANATRGQISKIVFLSITQPPGACAVLPTR